MTESVDETGKNQMRNVCLKNTSTASVTAAICVQGNVPGDLSDLTSSFQLLKRRV